ncbi:MAG TPA: winged helix DNA-binding domain-containing protein [Candidatus Binatia bacterium]|nr:winged helix DNA-binding domain-containing protein [Candidatus Binatia bacterium]
MRATEIVRRRLVAHRLTGEPFASAVDAVRWLGAVQSQDYAAAKWGLSLRSRTATEAEVERLFNQGAILRTHVPRPTWHFMLPEDAGWLISLLGPRVRRGLTGRFRQLGIDETVIRGAEKAFESALQPGNPLTRQELATFLAARGISPEGQRLPHLLAAAELDRLLISGPRRGRQFTYGLFDERVVQPRRLDRAEALVELARRYLRSRGPASVQDFAWWSGLAASDARRGILDTGMEREEIDGQELWFDATSARGDAIPGGAHLLPNFDEYTVAYRDRSALDPDGAVDASLFSFGSVLSNVVTLDGIVRGSWRRTLERLRVTVDIRPVDRFRRGERAAVGGAAERLGRFLGLPVRLAWPERPGR